MMFNLCPNYKYAEFFTASVSFSIFTTQCLTYLIFSTHLFLVITTYIFNAPIYLIIYLLSVPPNINLLFSGFQFSFSHGS